MTGLSGTAIAAPVAKGSPCPIDPPVKANQSSGFEFQACGVTKNPDVAASSQTTTSSGSKLANKGPRFDAFSSPFDGASIIPSGINDLSILSVFNISLN